MAKTITTYNSLEERPDIKPQLKDYLTKTEFSLPAPFNKRDSVPEKQVLSEVIRKLQHNSIFYARLNLGGVIRQTKGGAILTANEMVGWPDVLVLFQGTFIGLEIKRFGGKITSQQLSILKAIRDNGGRSYIVTSATYLFKVFTNETIHYNLDGIPII